VIDFYTHHEFGAFGNPLNPEDFKHLNLFREEKDLPVVVN